MAQETTTLALEAALEPFAIKARTDLPVPMLRRLSQWTTGNRADVANALRAECQTVLGEIVLETGPVRKVDRSPDGRKPQNTTWHVMHTDAGPAAFIVRNVKPLSERVYQFLSDSVSDLSVPLSERLFDVEETVQSQDVVVSIERTRMTKRKPATLKVKMLIGNIDHRARTILVESEIPIFSETLSAASVATGASRPQDMATPIVDITRKNNLNEPK